MLGLGGVPEFFFWLESSYFCYLGAHAKFWNPTTTPSVRISNEPEEEERGKKEREENSIYSGHLRLCQQPRAAHALRSDQNSNLFFYWDNKKCAGGEDISF